MKLCSSARILSKRIGCYQAFLLLCTRSNMSSALTCKALYEPNTYLFLHCFVLVGLYRVGEIMLIGWKHYAPIVWMFQFLMISKMSVFIGCVSKILGNFNKNPVVTDFIECSDINDAFGFKKMRGFLVRDLLELTVDSFHSFKWPNANISIRYNHESSEAFLVSSLSRDTTFINFLLCCIARFQIISCTCPPNSYTFFFIIFLFFFIFSSYVVLLDGLEMFVLYTNTQLINARLQTRTVPKIFPAADAKL